MHDDQLNQLVARHAVFTTTAMHMQHPGDDSESWRRDWAAVNRLVDEINRLIKPSWNEDRRVMGGVLANNVSACPPRAAHRDPTRCNWFRPLGLSGRRQI